MRRTGRQTTSSRYRRGAHRARRSNDARESGDRILPGCSPFDIAESIRDVAARRRRRGTCRGRDCRYPAFPTASSRRRAAVAHASAGTVAVDRRLQHRGHLTRRDTHRLRRCTGGSLVRVLSASESAPVAGVEDIGNIGEPAFSPDGQSILFHSSGDQTLKRVSISGDAPVTLCPAVFPNGVSWSADGIVFVEPGRGILRLCSAGWHATDRLGSPSGADGTESPAPAGWRQTVVHAGVG